jgi:hypothetical protein
MNSVDAELIRAIRREFGKRPVDTTRLDIQVTNGRVIIGGTLANLRDQPTISLKDEITFLEKILMRNSLVKQLSMQCRLNQMEMKEKDEDGGRGRMRHH